MLKSNYSRSLRKNEERKMFDKDSDFAKTASKLCSINFRHHDPNQCVCEMCICGRHLCKVHVVRPDLSKQSTYRNQFYPKTRIPNIIAIAKETDPYNGPHIDPRSTYLKDYTGENGDKILRPKGPHDQLSFNGPTQLQTTYGNDFPGPRGIVAENVRP